MSSTYSDTTIHAVIQAEQVIFKCDEKNEGKVWFWQKIEIDRLSANKLKIH